MNAKYSNYKVLEVDSWKYEEEIQPARKYLRKNFFNITQIASFETAWHRDCLCSFLKPFNANNQRAA